MTSSTPGKQLSDLRITQALERLRDDHRSWRFEYQAGKGVPWTAFRERDQAWCGGHAVCEAVDPDPLRYLIGQAVETPVKVAGRAQHNERCVR